jgi:integrase
MASQQITFSRAVVSAITSPKTGRTYFRDEKTRGLVLDVQAGGAKTFQIYRKVNGKPTRIALGRFNPELPESREITNGIDPLTLIGHSADLNVRMARKLADAVNAALDRGINPAADVQQARMTASEEFTLRQAFERYYKDHLVPHGKKTSEDLRNDFARYLGKVPPGQKKPRGKEKKKSAGSVDWEQRRLSAITQDNVRQLMISLQAGVGSRTANKVFVLLRSIFNAMIAWKLYTGDNPCSHIAKFKEVSRERFIVGDELPRFMELLNKDQHPDFKDFVLLSLFTGARRANVLSMRWNDVDLDAGIWTVPGEQSKNGSPLTISITSNVRQVLAARKAEILTNAGNIAICSTFVFPAISATGHISPPNKRWKQLLEDAGLTDLRLHDLRRSLGSWAAITGASLPVIGRALGHKTAAATMVYARLQHDPIVEAMERATTAMLDKANVAQPIIAVDTATPEYLNTHGRNL